MPPTCDADGARAKNGRIMANECVIRHDRSGIEYDATQDIEVSGLHDEIDDERICAEGPLEIFFGRSADEHAD